jgi:hypothetical protein
LNFHSIATRCINTISKHSIEFSKFEIVEKAAIEEHLILSLNHVLLIKERTIQILRYKSVLTVFSVTDTIQRKNKRHKCEKMHVKTIPCEPITKSWHVLNERHNGKHNLRNSSVSSNNYMMQSWNYNSCKHK